MCYYLSALIVFHQTAKEIDKFKLMVIFYNMKFHIGVLVWVCVGGGGGGYTLMIYIKIGCQLL